MLEQARDVASGVELHCMDLRNPWPVEEGSMDAVVINLVLEHIEDLSCVARECARVVRPGGTVRVSELHPERQAEGKKARFMRHGEVTEIPAVLHSRAELLSAFEQEGMTCTAARDIRGPEDRPERPPRLLIATFEKP